MNIETYEILCRCKAELKVCYQQQTAHNETEAFECPNCGEEYTVRASMPIMTSDIRVLTKGINIQPNDLDPRKIYKILSEKGAPCLFHANTVGTSCTFMEQASLLSREQIEARGLFQTSQYTDRLDKKCGIFNDVFLDFVDIHPRKGDINLYGPVLFEFPLTLLRDYPLHFVRITKINPDSWLPSDKLERRYFISEEEFEKQYHLGNFGSMMMLPYVNGELPLANNLIRIKIDAPNLSWKATKKNLYTEALEYLTEARKKGTLTQIMAKKRICNKEVCECYNTYSNHGEIKRLFKGHSTSNNSK